MSATSRANQRYEQFKGSIVVGDSVTEASAGRLAER